MAFWKPGTARPGSSVDRSTETEGSFDPGLSSSLAAQSATLGIHDARINLPIFKQKQQLLYMVEKHPVVVVVGQTGSGKTTQLPQFLMEAGWASFGHQIACTQPRRVAATSVAARVAQEVGTILGEEVGYTIRFEDCSHPTRTRIKYMTDGILFRECMRDPLLSAYSVIMVDEAHERGAYTDLLLGILKKIQRKRPELRLIISSATIDAQMFVDFFTSDELPSARDLNKPAQQSQAAAIVSLEGRMHPVELAYATEPCSDYVRAAADTVMKIHLQEPQGDVLVFLTGREEIDTCMQDLADRMLSLPKGSPGLHLLPLHAGLTVEEQAAIFERAPRGSRKVVVATNIAEASVTIDGIKYVVDCGFVKLRTFDPRMGMDVLAVVPESVASATQRAGRAGRTSAGKCFRLFTEAALSLLPESTAPELCRSDISMQVLQLKALGIDNLARFEFLPPAPPAEMMVRALEFLASLEVLDDYGRLTKPLGERMAEVPADPMLAKIVSCGDSRPFGFPFSLFPAVDGRIVEGISTNAFSLRAPPRCLATASRLAKPRLQRRNPQHRRHDVRLVSLPDPGRRPLRRRPRGGARTAQIHRPRGRPPDAAQRLQRIRRSAPRQEIGKVVRRPPPQLQVLKPCRQYSQPAREVSKEVWAEDCELWRRGGEGEEVFGQGIFQECGEVAE
ncbi:hypothetical protein ACQY0O_000326 [Thecaphora frezii]